MTAAIGLSWTIVAIAEHVADLIGPNLYRSGLLSKALEAAVILLGAAVFVISARGSRFAGARHP
jgi:hypothetical protein